MMRITSHELHKLAGTWKAWAALAALLIVNIALAVGTSDARMSAIFSSPSEYKSLYGSLSAMPETEAMSSLENAIEEHRTDAFWKDMPLYRLIHAEMRERELYGGYLERIGESAERQKTFGYFSDAASFSYRNAEKTASDFRGIEGIRPSFGPSLGIAMATEGDYTDVLSILAAIVASLLLFTYEKERGLALLTRTAYRGGAAHATGKLLSVWAACAVVVAALYVPKLIVNGILFGLGDLSRPIQSVAGYSGGTLRLSVRQFLACYWGMKLAALMSLSAMFALFAAVSRKASQGFVLTAAALGGMYAVSLIPNWHPVSLAAAIQPLSWMKGENLLARYMNCNIFGVPVGRLSICLVALAVSVAALSALSVAVFAKQKNIDQRKKKSTRNAAAATGGKRVAGRCRIFCGEARKLLIQNRTAWILLGFAAAVAYAHVAMPIKERFDDIDAMYYKRIATLHGGELTAEKECAIYIEAQPDGMVTANLEQRLRDHIEYLHTKPSSLLLYDEGYRKLTFADARSELWLLLAALAVQSAVLGGLHTVERQTGAIVLIRTSRWGTLKAYRAKRVLSATVTLLIWAMLYVPHLAGTLAAYGSHMLSAPAYSMEHLWFMPASVTVATALALCLLLRLSALLVASRLVLWCSKRAKNVTQAYAMCCGLLIAPVTLTQALL